MPANITHAFVSAASDGSNASKLQPSAWNAPHNVTLSITSADFNAGYVDGAPATASLRTLGTGSNQALPGNALSNTSITASLKVSPTSAILMADANGAVTNVSIGGNLTFNATTKVLSAATGGNVSNGDSPTFGNVTITGQTANAALTIGPGGAITSSNVTSTELGYLSGLTSNVQSQINSKQSSASLGNLAYQNGTFSGTSSGTNTGDQDLSGLMVKANNLSDLANVTASRANLGLGNLALQNGTFSGNGTVATAGFSLTLSANATVGGNNTGDQDLSGYVPTSRTINGHDLTANFSITKGDVGLGNAENTALSTWAGSTAITTLGTISSGTWNGTVIANGYIASALSGKTYNELTLAAQATGFTIAGGTASRTLTVGANASVSGTNTGDQDLSGYVPTSRTINGYALSANVTLSKGDIGLGNAENTALSTWSGSANLVTVGTISTGTWNGTAVANAYIASALSGKTYEGLTLTAQSVGFTVAGGTASRTLTVGANASVSGTNTGDQDLSGYVPTSRTINGQALSANVTITKGDVGLGNVENTALSTWGGTTSLVTLGTITTGTWNGTTIANAYIASALSEKTYNGLTLATPATGFSVEGNGANLTVMANSSVNGTLSGGGAVATSGFTLTVLANSSINGTLDPSVYVPISRTVNGYALSSNVTISKGDLGLGNVENTALSTWPGTTSITTLGTITTGTWTGTAVGNSYIASALSGKTYDGLTLAAQSVGFTVAGGTASRTLTVNGNATVNGTNTGDQDLSGYVPISRTVNGHALSGDVTVTKGDVGLGNAENTAISTWAGSTNLVTLGTITTGTWNGSTIANGYVAAALTGKTYNGLTLATPTAGFSIEGNGANLTVLANSSVNGTLSGGGTVATAGFTLTVLSNSSINGTLDQDLSGYLLKSDNLASLANASTSRTNLGLGNLSLQNGTFSGNGTFASAGYCLTLTANVTVGNNSEVWLYGGNGFGSTNTKIRRYTTTSINTGSDITYADSASNGASFTINTAGRYSITITDANSGSNVQIGISKNSSQLTTSIMSITAANFVAAGPTGGVGFTGCVSVVLNLAVNDVIRPHGAGTLTNDTSSLVTFRIVYLGP